MAEETKEAAPAAPEAAAEGAKKAKRKTKKSILNGVVHIQSTFNNTIVTVTDPQGNTLAWTSTGSVGSNALIGCHPGGQMFDAAPASFLQRAHFASPNPAEGNSYFNRQTILAFATLIQNAQL